MKQREAVYKAVTEVFNSNNIEFAPGEIDARSLITADLRSQVTDRVVEMFKSGLVSFKDTASNADKLKDDAKLTSYTVGLITNWLNKDPNLNGGSKYAPKNPGSRAGQSDAQIREMRKLKQQLATQGNADAALKVDEAIANRIAQIKASKLPQQTEIDLDALPEELKALVNDLD